MHADATVQMLKVRHAESAICFPCQSDRKGFRGERRKVKRA